MADASFGSAMSSAFWLACVVAVVILQHSLLLVEIEGAPQADLVKRLPGQPKVPFKQYAGYIVVDEVAGRALFYYFVEAETHPESKPLTLWLNGGPGCSSVSYGAFEELGPFRPNGLGRGLVRNKHSWNKASNLLFVESPAGVGFSYSNTTSDRNTNDTKTAQDSLTFLLGWFEKFPAYKSRDFFLTGESYAGHYIPQLASLLLEYNDRWRSQIFNLKGVAIGNPLLDIAIDVYAEFFYQWSHGILSDETFNDIINSCNFDVYTKSPPHNESTKCNRYLDSSIVEMGNFINSYDVNIDVCYTSIAEQEIRLNKKIHNFSLGVDVCMDSEIEFYMNLPKVQKAFHANTTHLGYNWSRCGSNASLNYSETDASIEMTPYLKDILNHGIRLWIYSGDLDAVIPLTGTRIIVKKLAQSMNLMRTESYRAWYRKGQVGGWTMSYGNLTYATVRGAGHMVPMTQPARALLLFEKFLLGKPLPNTNLASPN